MSAQHTLDRTLSKAQRLAKRGDVMAAHALYRKVLEDRPANTRARAGLSALREPLPISATPHNKSLLQGLSQVLRLSRAGRNKDALAIAIPLAAQNPGSVQALYTLGGVYMRLSEWSEAARAMAAALALQPTCAPASTALARALTRLGDRSGAISHLTNAAKLDPTCAAIPAELGQILAGAGRHRDALSAFDAALALEPDDADTLLRRGDAHSKRGNHVAAIADQKRAAALLPADIRPPLALAEAQRAVRRHGDAAATIGAALQTHPDAPELHNCLGLTLGELGEADAARTAFWSALEHAPDHVPARVNLTLWSKATVGCPHVAHMERMLSRVTNPDDRMDLHFAMGKIWHELGDPERAFDHFADGNALRRARRPYDPALTANAFEAIRRVFAEGPLEPWGGATDDGPTPIFMVGMPRSGSSLTEHLLASHSKVEGVGEPCALEIALEPLFDQVRKGQPISQDILGTVRRHYRAAIAQFGVTSPVVVDKELSNFRWAGFISAVFPDAKIIAMERDPMATGWSIFRHHFSGGGHNYAYALSDIAHYFALHTDMMAWWRDMLPGKTFTVNYEALTMDPEAAMRRLLGHCGLEFEPRCAETGGTNRAVTTASAGQVRDKIYIGSSEEWRGYEKQLRPLKDALAMGRMI